MSTSEILSNLSKTPSPFHAVALLRERLLSGGYEEIDERKGKPLVPGKGYFLTRNGSSLIAFFLPASFRPSFRLSMVHLDSPTWKLKPGPVIEREEGTLLNVEPYGGLIDYTWFDRPLTLAGRLLVKEGKAIVSRLFYVDKDLALIPSLAIHLNRGVNESAHFDRSRQTLPLFALGKVDFPSFLAKEAGVEKDSIRGFDLFLASRAKATLLGENGEFIGSPRLDDLASAYSSFEGFLASRKGLDIAVYAAFDNEEVGSLTRQGANSTFLRDCLSMIAEKASFSLREAAASSFALSIDNAHATHPNFVEYQDRTSRRMPSPLPFSGKSPIGSSFPFRNSPIGATLEADRRSAISRIPRFPSFPRISASPSWRCIPPTRYVPPRTWRRWRSSWLPSTRRPFG